MSDIIQLRDASEGALVRRVSDGSVGVLSRKPSIQFDSYLAREVAVTGNGRSEWWDVACEIEVIDLHKLMRETVRLTGTLKKQRAILATLLLRQRRIGQRIFLSNREMDAVSDLFLDGFDLDNGIVIWLKEK